MSYLDRELVKSYAALCNQARLGELSEFSARLLQKIADELARIA